MRHGRLGREGVRAALPAANRCHGHSGHRPFMGRMPMHVAPCSQRSGRERRRLAQGHVETSAFSTRQSYTILISLSSKKCKIQRLQTIAGGADEGSRCRTQAGADVFFNVCDVGNAAFGVPSGSHASYPRSLPQPPVAWPSWPCASGAALPAAIVCHGHSGHRPFMGRMPMPRCAGRAMPCPYGGPSSAGPGRTQFGPTALVAASPRCPDKPVGLAHVQGYVIIARSAVLHTHCELL